MATLYEAAIELGRQAVVDTAADANKFYGLAGRVGQRTGSGLLEVGDTVRESLSFWRGVINPGTLQPGSFGGGGSGSGGAGGSFPGLPSLQGQCDLEPYNITFSYTQASGTRTTSPVNGLLGPIGEIIVSQLSGGNFRAQIQCRGFVGGTPQSFPFLFTLLSNISNSNFDPVLETVTRVDGEPDDCGGVAPPPEPDFSPVPYDLVFDASDGTPVTLPVEATSLAPTINLNGELTFPVNIVGPNLNVNVEVNPGCGLACIGPAGIIPVLLPELVDLIDDITAENELPVPYQEAITPAIVGVVVVIDTPEENLPSTQVFPDNGPTILLPDTGLVRFKERLFGDWSEPFKVQTNGQRIDCPFPSGASEVSLAPRENVLWTVQNIFGNVAETTRD